MVLGRKVDRCHWFFILPQSVVAFVFGVRGSFDRWMQRRIKVGRCNSPVSFFNVLSIRQKFKIQLNGIAIKLFMGKYLIYAGL